MNQHQVLNALNKLQNKIASFIEVFENDTAGSSGFQNYYEVIAKARIYNQWFTDVNIIRAFKGIEFMLSQTALNNWVSLYDFKNSNPKQVGIIMAGNIPMVGFHDLICVLLSGNVAVVKTATDDTVLMKLLIDELKSIEPAFHEKIILTERLNNLDAVIATGSNNSSRYFEYYFGNIPHIIRRNRNSIALLSGHETIDELKALAEDIFSFFGLGCRNVSKLYVPLGYDFSLFFESQLGFSDVLNHNKYMNNFDYHQAIYLLNQQPFLTNNFLIIKEDNALATPVSVLNYEFYKNENTLCNELSDDKIINQIQCISSNMTLPLKTVKLGKTQFPAVDDYADGVDTMAFLKLLI